MDLSNTDFNLKTPVMASMDASNDVSLKTPMMAMDPSNYVSLQTPKPMMMEPPEDVTLQTPKPVVIELNSKRKVGRPEKKPEPPPDDTGPKVALKSHIELPYLQQEVIEDFANLIIKSQDGLVIEVNPWLLVSCSDLMKIVLHDFLVGQVEQEAVISTNLSYTDLKNFQEFIMKGVLPCPKEDILSDRMDPHMDAVFASFGVDLKYLMKYFYIKNDTSLSDLDENDNNSKPSYKYKHLAILALSPSKKLGLDDIYKFIKKEFPFFKGKENWQRGVRQCLNTHKKIFSKVKKGKSKTLWTLYDEKSERRAERSIQNNVRMDYNDYNDYEVAEPVVNIKEEPKWANENDYFVDNNDDYYDNDNDDDWTPPEDKKINMKKIMEPAMDLIEAKDYDVKEDGNIVPMSFPREKREPKCFLCGYCEQTFNNTLELKDHVQEFHGESKNKCTLCDKIFKFSQPSALRSHLKVFHGKYQNFKCGHCETNFSRLRDLKAHVMEVHGKTKNRCSLCEKEFNVERPIDLKRHIEGVHKKTMHLKCEFCEKQFSSEDRLKGHIRITHTGLKKDLKCKFCQELFEDSLHLKTHIDNVHKTNPDWPCNFCDRNFERFVQLSSHCHKEHKPLEVIEDDMKADPNLLLSRYRGIWNHNIGVKQEHFNYLSFEKMLEFQMTYQNYFTIKIPPEDFTPANFANFEFPKPIEELGVVPEDQFNMSSNGRVVCMECNKSFSSLYLYKEHFAQMHSMHYHCPYERCEFGALVTTIRQFAIHLYYHDNNHPQLAHQHECIACGMQTPYMEKVQNHLKSEGAFHDNQCPRCPERFYSHHDLADHMRNNNHIGYRCGMCAKVLDSLEEKKLHKKDCSDKKATEHICDECGQVFSTLAKFKAHMKLKHVDEASTCELCGKVFRSGFHLSEHRKKVHNKMPCTICGKMFGTKHKMKIHMLAVHTKDHLKPYVCNVCHKGFAVRKNFEQHMNIHTGAKPFKCMYCGRGFADDGNRRMHQKTTHEGYKRGFK